MRRILLHLLLMLFTILVGCSEDEEAISEIDMKTANEQVKNFIQEVESAEEGNENGIYLYNDSDKKRYLYLNENFLDEGKDFGEVDIQTDEEAIYIYLTDTTMKGREAAEYKLYQINMQENKEYLKVFKNEEETHFATIGM